MGEVGGEGEASKLREEAGEVVRSREGVGEAGSCWVEEGVDDCFEMGRSSTEVCLFEREVPKFSKLLRLW